MQDGSVTPIGNFFRNKWVRTVLVVDVIVIIVIATVAIYNSAKNSIINFTVTPIDSTITVNGDDSYHNGSFQFYPGSYEIVISHSGLDSKTFNIDLQSNSSAAITTFLAKNDSFDFYQLKDNYPSYLMLERIASSSDNQTTDHDTSAEEFIADFQRNYSLYSNELPVTYSEYDDSGKLSKYISVRENHNCIITLCLKAVVHSENDEALVNALLIGAGFNLEDFEIEYEIY